MADLLNSAYDLVLSTFRWGVIKVLAIGPVPQHIAFIMDGNRRYARQRSMAIKEGHTNGFQALEKVVDVCLKLGVKCVTVFAFSIENFKRSEEEVAALMELAETKLLDFTKATLHRDGVRVNVLGRMEMLPESVQKSFRISQEMTKDNFKHVLNFCMPYTSQDEITTAVQSAVQEKVCARVTEGDIERYLMTTLGGSPPLNILIRSGGAKRLSDFLMWQASENVQLHFIPTYWPDIGFWDLFPIIMDYQTKVWSRQEGKCGSKRWASVGFECVALIVIVTLFASLTRWRI
ncbi:Di-trans-poly-cis-decaprenylcistransferase [Thelephora terrestris]|uniref:Alkyl transferase n=1 Tax=Thelephora terrestris TaxID=56493 RepID=A0A9P6HLH9_9AGAM|nr:Di-trans-poly-cis-decaprenylcistransferase [Thelephora terrestris]